MADKINYGYAIEPRPADLGGGWRLRLLENGEEVGGGVFPLSAYLSDFPATDDANEREMADKAAYEDALAEASAWLATRPADDLTISPNARRQAAYAERQRALGRKKFSYWMRPDEAEQVSAFLRQLRERQIQETSTGTAPGPAHGAVVADAPTCTGDGADAVEPEIEPEG